MPFFGGIVKFDVYTETTSPRSFIIHVVQSRPKCPSRIYATRVRRRYSKKGFLYSGSSWNYSDHYQSRRHHFPGKLAVVYKNRVNLLRSVLCYHLGSGNWQKSPVETLLTNPKGQCRLIYFTDQSTLTLLVRCGRGSQVRIRACTRSAKYKPGPG